MSINYCELEKIVLDLKDFIIGSTIKKITQYNKNALIIEFRKQNKDLDLFLFIDSKYTFLGVCNFWGTAPKNPYHFTVVARKYLSNLVVIDFYSEKNDRILHIKFEQYQIIAELTGKNGNIFLVDKDNKILAVLRNRIGEKRIEKAGQRYIALGSKTQKEFTIREIFLKDPKIAFIKAVTDYYLKELATDKIVNQKKILENELKRKNQYLEKLNIEFDGIDENIYKQTADLIIENINNIDSVKDKLKLKLDEGKTASENAQYFYQLYKKQIRKKRQLQEFINSVKYKINRIINEISILKRTLLELENGQINAENILRSNFDFDKSKEEFSKIESNPLYSIIKTENGKKIVIGKSAAGNNEILKKFGKGNFWWFHIRDFQGPFVILMDQNLTPQEIKICGALALHFSKAKNSGKASVIYTKCKYVKPIPKTIGNATYSKEREIIAFSDSNLIKKLFEINENF